MITKCFTIYDKALNAFMQPFFSHTTGAAIRSFSDAVLDEKSQFRRHAPDFALYSCGEFDDAKGVFTQEVPERVIGAVEVLAVKEGEV